MRKAIACIDEKREAFRAALRRYGLAATYQRIRVAEAAFSTRAHFTAEELLKRVRRRDPRVGRVTVYRTLALLVRARLVEERPFQKDRVIYEHVVGRPHHDHLVCVRCGRIQEFSHPLIEEAHDGIARKFRFRILYHSHTLFGCCARCGAGR